MFVTVLENKPHVHESAGGFTGETVVTITHQDRSGMGDVLTVLSIELPYVVVRRECKANTMPFRYNIDTRRTSLMELKRDYVEALCPHLAATIARSTP